VEEVYIEQPDGFEQDKPGHVLRLRKSLYGLKQAPRVWNEKLDSALQQMSFTRVRCDKSIYVWEKKGIKVIVSVFVDDLTIVSPSKEAKDAVIKELSSRFKLRYLGPITLLLGVHITRDRPKRTMTLDQHQYILDLLDTFGFSSCSPVTTPMDPGVKLLTSMSPSCPNDLAFMKDKPYISAVGSLLYLATCTRPDISYAVGVLSCFTSNPGPAHWKAVKHLFRYLKGTADLRLVYAPDGSGKIFTSYSDADHGGNPDNGRSTSGYILKIGTGAISWSLKLQTIVALSTTEAEYVAACFGGREIMWLRNLLNELGFNLNGSSCLQVDNQLAISVAKNPQHHGRMKHLDLTFYWLRDAVEVGKIAVGYIPTAEMPADLLTKALERVKVVTCRRMMGLM
jgi:hypothetical protein